MNNDVIFDKLNEDYKFLKGIYQNDDIFGLFVFGRNEQVEALVIPTFENVCLNLPLINSVVRNGDHAINVLDIRYIYNATKLGYGEIIEGLYTDYYLINPTYEHMYQKLLRVNRDIISEGIRNSTPALELKIALMKIMRTSFNDNSAVVRFLKQLTDAEKLALEGLIQAIGDEGTIPIYKISSSVGVSRLTLTNLLNKMEIGGVATINNLGPRGTYIKFIDDTLLRIRG